MKGAWVAVACAEHVRRGRAKGFMQVCHGKRGPLRRLRPGDGIVYYSPTFVLGSKQPYRAFTAIGVVRAEEPYEADAGPGFRPWRRAVDWEGCEEVFAAGLLPDLSIAAGRRNWAYGLRFGLMSLPVADYAVIRAALTAAGGDACSHESR